MRLLLGLSIALLAAAAPVPVATWDSSTDFHQMRTYSWVFRHTPTGMDPNLYRQVRVSVDRSLAAHGFVKSEPGDFAVAFTLGPRANVHPYDFGHYAPYYSGSEAAAHQHWVNHELADRSSRDHTLAIDMYNTFTKHAIWHGLAPDPIMPNTRQAIVEHEVDDVLSQFPPKSHPAG
jgi:uncharacterized protein DUF4136